MNFNTEFLYNDMFSQLSNNGPMEKQSIVC